MIRLRTGARFLDEVPVGSDGRAVLWCWQDYLVESPEPPSLPLSCISKELPREDGWSALVNFGDYVGLLSLGDTVCEIRSRKLDSDGFEALLRDISARIANLPFDINSPSFVPFSRDDTDERDRLYQAFVYLRWAMWSSSPSLHESWAAISADPHRALVREERRETPWQARGITPRTLERIASHPEDWVHLRNDSPLGSTPLARALTDRSGRSHFPREIVEVVAEPTLDTPENRFAKYFLLRAHELVERFLGILNLQPAADPSLIADAQELAREFRAMEQAPFLRDVGDMCSFPAQSQVLQKRIGYRELLLHYHALSLASRYPISASDLRRIIETKSASLLYEYWCYFELAEEIRGLGFRPVQGITVGGDEMAAVLNEGIKIVFEGGVELHYNRSFSRSNAQWRSYSVALRPDIVLKVGDTLHLFDAKFRIEKWTTADFEPDAAAEDALEDDDRAGRASPIWWKNADIHKMHAYRDALGTDGAHVATVRALYPGTETVFYPSEPAGGEGVGAVPLAPGGSGEALSGVLEDVLSDAMARRS